MRTPQAQAEDQLEDGWGAQACQDPAPQLLPPSFRGGTQPPPPLRLSGSKSPPSCLCSALPRVPWPGAPREPALKATLLSGLAASGPPWPPDLPPPTAARGSRPPVSSRLMQQKLLRAWDGENEGGSEGVCECKGGTTVTQQTLSPCWVPATVPGRVPEQREPLLSRSGSLDGGRCRPEAGLPALRPQLHCLPTACRWVGDLSLLGLSLPICTMGVTTVLASQDCHTSHSAG